MSEKTKTLVVFANPKGSDPLRLGAEDRTIHECIKLAKNRDNLHLVTLHAARVRDVQLALLEDDYHIVHFSGHGAPSGQLILENELGEPKFIPQQALAHLLSSFDSIGCVILNACYAVSQGRLISMNAQATIAMDGPISDDAARIFARGFYDAVGAGKDYRLAYQMGRLAVELEGLELESEFLVQQ